MTETGNMERNQGDEIRRKETRRGEETSEGDKQREKTRRGIN